MQEQTQESRFAVVLNGGVSLAVWMGGVVHELNRLRLASVSDPRAKPANRQEADVHEAWVKILGAAKRKAVVDVIAGTSAGGLNGTILAAAVAQGKDLPPMRDLWSEQATLEESTLLPGDDGQSSLLDGTFFEGKIKELLQEVAAADPVTEAEDCTLLVTATALDAEMVPFTTEDGRAVQLLDSRRVYQFERRTDDRPCETTPGQRWVTTDFEDCGRLALAARASASFPLAFAPVPESAELAKLRQTTTAGATERPLPIDGPLLIDGGVLDNAPFEPLMKILQARPVGAPFERVLLYITPSPGVSSTQPSGVGHHTSGPSLDDETALSRDDSVVASTDDDLSAFQVLRLVFNAAREPDQRLDVEALRDAFTLMGYTRATASMAIARLLRAEDPEVLAADAKQAAGHWFETYRYSRTEAVGRLYIARNANVAFANPDDVDLEPEDVQSVPENLAFAPDWWRWGLSTAERLLRWWGRALVYCAKGGTAVPDPAFETLQNAQRRIARYRRDLEAELRKESPKADIERLSAVVNGFLTSSAVQTGLIEAVVETAEAVAPVANDADLNATTLIDFTLAVEVISSVLAWADDSEGDIPHFRYRQVTPAARSIIDIDIDIDPLDEDDDTWPKRKLIGERFGHFGAFLSDQGRRSDWLWGRLDGASALADYLLGPGADEQGLKKDLAHAIVKAERGEPDDLPGIARQLNGIDNELDLLRAMPNQERDRILGALWRKAVQISGSATGGPKPAPLHWVRIFADPTWEPPELQPRAVLTTRVLARLTRLYGAPVRWYIRRKIDQTLATGGANAAWLYAPKQPESG